MSSKLRNPFTKSVSITANEKTTSGTVNDTDFPTIDTDFPTIDTPPLDRTYNQDRISYTISPNPFNRSPFVPSTPTTFNPTSFNVSSPSSIVSFQPPNSTSFPFTPTSLTSPSSTAAFHLHNTTKLKLPLRKSSSMVNMRRNDYGVFEYNFGDNSRKNNTSTAAVNMINRASTPGIIMSTTTNTSPTSTATITSPTLTTTNTSPTLTTTNANSTSTHENTKDGTDIDKDEQVVSWNGVTASGSNNLSYGIVSSSGPTDALSVNDASSGKSRSIYKGPIRKWHSLSSGLSSFYDDNARTDENVNGTEIELALRGIREEETNETEIKERRDMEEKKTNDFEEKGIRDSQGVKFLEAGEGIGSENDEVGSGSGSRSNGVGLGVESDEGCISEGSNEDVRAIYEYHQITLSKSDVDSDRFCGVVDRYGFIITEDEGEDELPDLTPHEIRLENKESQRSQKWIKWVATSKFVKKSGKFGVSNYVFPWDTKFHNRIYKGIPNSWRQPVWYFLLTNGGSESEFDDNLTRIYETLLTLSSQHERQINLDVPRTLHSHIMFRTRYGPGQRALFNVLRGFSNYDKQVGYCQGMTNIVAILLMYYTEENAFIMLTKLFTRCNLHNLYIPGFPALLESFYVQEKLMMLYAPDISEKFNKLQIACTAYATRWYITLFTSDVVPHHTVLRIWDLLMLNGFDVLYFVAVALLKYHKATLLASTFEHIMIMLSTKLAIDDDDRLIRKVSKLYERRGRKRLVDTLKAEYRSRTK